ncbi:MAG: glutamate racemase [Candidatus Omnitrophica bacterium]|nr:glutamate racemase [Candidatus Omnitrophota bacterium]
MNKELPIAIFDSGIGGLTVAKRLYRLLPKEKIIYFGDTARVPYGTKSAETIKQYAIQITRFLIRFNPKIIVIACHSVSSLGTSFLKRRFPGITFIDVINPSALQALKTTRNKKIGVIGTPATISSKRYESIIKRIDSQVHVYQKACPLLVPLAEEGWFDTDVTKNIISYYVDDLLEKQIDTLILGCTHYPLLEKAIRAVVGPSVFLVDASEATGIKVKKVLQQQDLLNKGKLKKHVPVLFFSDLPDYRKKIMSRFWNTQALLIKKASTGGKKNV